MSHKIVQNKQLRTSIPNGVPTSVAVRAATDVTATRRGCVQAITFPSEDQPLSCRYCGISENEMKQSAAIVVQDTHE
jgi:hypothetical protein